ncbi:unnamed protein product [Sphenostylis stenocarpa]|uniref:B-like cyclin n=1 Tax=Sphenostylis stenocarpa TaxID=92480 RepID=A0AA86T6J5_9FABA|nr:unnamed protein product [Sphenostylis stenocarpa]
MTNARPPRAAKRKAAAAISELLRPASKKRVALGDLTNAAATSEKPVSRIFNREGRKLEKANAAQPSGPYDSDIYEYLRALEVAPSTQPLVDYVETVQTVVDADARGNVVNWLVKVAEECKFLPDTLHSCIAYIDRFLSFNACSRQRLPLLGMAAMLVAVKYEEGRKPVVQKVYYIAGNTYSKEEVVNMEADILKSLKYELGSPTALTFLTRFCKVGQEGVGAYSKFECLSNYLGELSLLEYSCIKFLPSLVAASAVFLARFMLSTKKNPWNSTLHQLTRYTPSDLKECVLIIHDLYLSRRAKSLAGIREKYKQEKFKCVATTPSPRKIPTSVFL